MVWIFLASLQNKPAASHLMYSIHAAWAKIWQPTCALTKTIGQFSKHRFETHLMIIICAWWFWVIQVAAGSMMASWWEHVWNSFALPSLPWLTNSAVNCLIMLSLNWWHATNKALNWHSFRECAATMISNDMLCFKSDHFWISLPSVKQTMWRTVEHSRQLRI